MNFNSMTDEQLTALNAAILTEMAARRTAKSAQEALELLMATQPMDDLKAVNLTLRGHLPLRSKGNQTATQLAKV